MSKKRCFQLGVIGNPVRHSRSPQIHQLFGRMVQEQVEYQRIIASPDQFSAVVQDFFHLGGQGLNVTLPFKLTAAALADRLTERAAMVGAVNTLYLEQGKLVGDTTDGQGFVQDVSRLVGPSAFEANIVIIGAGGAVKSLLPDLLKQKPKKLSIFNRTAAKAEELIGQAQSWLEVLGCQTILQGGSLDDMNVAMREAGAEVSLLVQGTSAGGLDAVCGSQDWNLSETVCYDLNYGERARAFLQWSSSRGAVHCFDGLGMLVGQASASFEVWVGKNIQIGEAMDALKNENVWLASWWTPPFYTIDIQQLRASIKQALAQKEMFLAETLPKLHNGDIPLSWEHFIEEYEAHNDALLRVWGALGHLNSVASTAETREHYNELQVTLSEHFTREQQNPIFKDLVGRLSSSDQSKSFSAAQKKWCENALRDFQLAGADLPGAEQVEYARREQELAKLTTEFADKVLDATEVWHLDIARDLLPGVPETTLEAAQAHYDQAHPQAQESLCRLTLKGPCYLAVSKFCENREVRRQIYEGYATRASDQGPQAGEFDTSDLIKQILLKRSQQANSLGFDSFAEYSLATKMASTAEDVVRFLQHLGSLSKPQALQEKAALETFARENLNLDHLEPWDYSFASEKLKQARYSIDTETIRDYFPTDHVLQGLFSLLRSLFQVECVENATIPVYHEDVRFIELRRDGQVIGGLFIDLYAREKKRGGAWMDVCRQRRVSEHEQVSPIAYLVCNASAPTVTKPSLMTHDEVVTLFHETGHCLHHVLTQVKVAGLAGIDGVEWDAVEVPSQLLENWCYRPEVLPLLSQHYKTGDPLPRAELDKIIAAKNFQSALSMMKQLEYALFDMQIHCASPAAAEQVPDVLEVLEKVRADVGVLPVPAWHRFANGFSHIFAGGYAAGYYGYKWAEVYAADLFSRFRTEGVMSPKLGQELCKEWLSMGGVRSASDNFSAFMARDVDLTALIQDLDIQVGVAG